tara:strand:- start:182 stop:1231 length:1050 start_codon:yes stop_codon:yes gene_type:complete
MPAITMTPIDQNNDVTTTTTLLHEVIPITGTIFSGTYGTFPNDDNIKNYTHGMFQSVYDYPYLSSSANHIVDLTMGYDETSTYAGAGSIMNTKKKNMYNEFAQVMLGYTSSTADSIRKFESDLNLDGVGTMNETFFLSFARLLTKDQIKRNSVSLAFGTASNYADPFTGHIMTLTDASASYGSTSGVGSAVGGEYGVLYSADNTAHGVVFYQAGIMVVSSSVFALTTEFAEASAGSTVVTTMTGSPISGACDALRHRLYNVSFNNTTEINSTIYFCRIPHNKYNYSSNPTYVDGSKIRVKNQESDDPVSYITTVGLYNDAGEQLAVAKLSEPLKKSPTNDITIRVRLDY